MERTKKEQVDYRATYMIKDKQAVARTILENLPEWFGIVSAREEYIADSAQQTMFAAFDENKPVGFLCLKETGKATIEIQVMGVLKDYQRLGIGRKLFAEAKSWSVLQGYSFMQVKTVQMGRYKEYDVTNAFYRSLGFKEFEVFPNLWDEWNPCQVYIMSL